MFFTELVLGPRKRAFVVIFWISLLAKHSTGLTKCGWIFRDGLLSPQLSQFTASFKLTTTPVVNTSTAWCIPVKNHSLTVNIGSVTNITRLAVQGDNTTNYVTAYEVDHSIDGVTFTNIKNGLKPKCSAKEFFGAFPGLSTGSTVAESNISNPFRAQYVRFRPQESVGELCTRVDIYGCQSDIGYTSWTSWSLCTPTPACSRSRLRTCERKNDGCMGASNETEGCVKTQCFRVCGELGIIDENRSVNDTAFMASSFKPGFEPYKARLNGPSAWCAAIGDQNQYLEIDLGGETEISEIRTQGLQTGNMSAWVERFFLDFRRTGNSEWKDYVENNSVRIYEGNDNGREIHSYTLADVPTARFIRFYPLQWVQMICMRVSVSGCRVPTILGPVTGSTEEEVDEAFWVILWILLALLLLLLLLGLLYLCCRYCPCCACCGCFPCAKKRRTRMRDETMMTELTSDEIDAGRVQRSAGFTQTNGGIAETETQTLAIRLGAEAGHSAGTGAVFFSRTEGNVADTTASGGQYNDGFKFGEKYQQATSSGIDTTRREEMHVGAAVSGRSHVDGARGGRSHVDGARGTGMSRDKMMTTQGERMRSSQYEGGATRSYQDSLRATSGGAQYIGQYDVETAYPGEGTWKRNRVVVGPPPVIELEVTPRHEDGSWRVERIEEVDDRLRVGAVGGGKARGSELMYNGVGYRSVEEGGRALGLEYNGPVSTRELEYKGVGHRGIDEGGRNRGLGYNVPVGHRGVDEGDTTITVHLQGDTFPARLETRELESGDVCRADRERYFNDDTYRARRGGGGVETWKVDSIRGQAFEGTVNVDTARGQVTGQPYQYKAPSSPSTSITSSQFDGSTISEQFGGHGSKKGKYYKMFGYSQE